MSGFRQLSNLKLPGIVFFSVAFLFVGSAFGQSPVELIVNPQAPGSMIPTDFSGLSFPTGSEMKNHDGVAGYLFDSTNAELITLFRQLGIKNLRVGGTSVDEPGTNPTGSDIDALFRFAKAADIKVIYSVRLLNGNSGEDASIAKYVWKNYRRYLDCFAIGNEPDWHSYHIKDPEIYETTPGVPGSAYPSYLAKWKRFATAILDSVPAARFTGPDAGSNYPVPGAKNTTYDGKTWATNFAQDIANWHFPHSGSLAFVSQHNYVGQGSVGQGLTPREMICQMLSPKWVTSYYPLLYNAIGTPALPQGIGYRLTESNSFSGGVAGGSDCFATALFALDYMHWWAEHNCAGVNFHTAPWKYNGTIYLDADGNYRIHPMGYGIKAFDLGGHGRVEPVTIKNLDSFNLTAYAVNDSGVLYITIINKEHGAVAHNANVRLQTSGHISGRPEVVYLTSPHDNPAATSGIRLGDARVTEKWLWKGTWTSLSPDSCRESAGIAVCGVKVPPTSAAIVRIETGRSHR